MIEITETKKVPKLPIPQEDKDNASQKEAAEMARGGNLEVCVQGSKRTIKAYTVTANELDSISIYNTLSALFFALTSSFLSFYFGLKIQYEFSDAHNISPTAKAIYELGTPISCILCIIFFFVSVWFYWKRKNLKDMLKQETHHNEL